VKDEWVGMMTVMFSKSFAKEEHFITITFHSHTKPTVVGGAEDRLSMGCVM